MRKQNIPQLFSLEPGQIREVVNDLHYFLRNYKVIIAVETHEVFDYCFPVNPTDKNKEINAESIAESQVALNYLFDAGQPDRPRVILLPEYQEELQRVRNAVHQSADEAYGAGEMIQAMIKAGGLQGATKQQRTNLESVVQKSFQFLLTILLGIHSSGVKRLDETCAKGLTTLEDSVEPEDRANFRQMLDKYERTEFYDEVFNALEKDNRHGDVKERELTRFANERDASAIDRLGYLNDVSRSTHLEHEYLFLYVSTAQKSRRIFEEPSVRALLPKVRGRRYSFWRTRDQVLAYVIYRGLGNNIIERAEKTVEALHSMHRTSWKLSEFRRRINDESNDCGRCVLDGGLPTSCAHESHCNELLPILNKIKEKSAEVKNWGLFQHIKSYASLLNAQGPQLVGYEVCMLLFQELLETRGLTDLALERMYQRHVWISRASSRASEWMLLTLPSKDDLKLARERDMHSEKDKVRGVYQYLPCMPRLRSERYREIVNLVTEFFSQPGRRELAEAAYDKFNSLDPASELDGEYDLSMCYLYLAFGYDEEKVHSHIKATLMPEGEEKANGDTWRESLYILCWSARRAGLYADADSFARQGIDDYPDDPRFPHGRALNIYTWYEIGDACPYGIRDAIAASELALKLYRSPEFESAEQLAANHNNLAFFLAEEVKKSDNPDRAALRQKLNEARAHLIELKSIVSKKNDWNPAHPEFYHTEAFLELQEVKNSWVGRELGEEELKNKLRSARRDIDIAISIYDRLRYRELREDIDNLPNV